MTLPSSEAASPAGSISVGSAATKSGSQYGRVTKPATTSPPTSKTMPRMRNVIESHIAPSSVGS